MPKITEVVISAGRTFNHPHESYSNLRPQVTFKAEVLDGEDAIEVAKDLQAKAEGLIEDHKRMMLESIEELYDLGQKQARIAGLRSTIERAQQELDEARKGLPAPESGGRYSRFDPDTGSEGDELDDDELEERDDEFTRREARDRLGDL